MFFDGWRCNQRSAAAIAGFTDAQVGHFYDRYDLFTEKARGRGIPVRYDFGDLIKLGAVGALLEIGFASSEATQALRGKNILGTLTRMGASVAHFPGSLFLTRNQDGAWIAADDAAKKVYVEIRLWPIFDEIFKATSEHLLDPSNRGEYSREEIIEGLLGATIHFNKIRTEQGY